MARLIGTVSSGRRRSPDAPTIGTATDVGTSRAYNDGAATVTFTAPSYNGGLPVTSYTVTSSPGGFTASGASSPLTVTGLASNTAYTFTVTATNGVGTSASSSASNSITATTVPQAPTIGTATAGNTSATVTFTGNATGGKAISTYTATSSPSSITGSSATSPITVSGLTNNTAYTFTVTATNANGTSAASAASNSITPVSPYWIEYGAIPSNGDGESKGMTLLSNGNLTFGFSAATNQNGYITIDSTGAIVAQSRATYSFGGNTGFTVESFASDGQNPPYIYVAGLPYNINVANTGYTSFYNGSWATTQYNINGVAGRITNLKKSQQNNIDVFYNGIYRDDGTGNLFMQTGRFQSAAVANANWYTPAGSFCRALDIDTSGNMINGGQLEGSPGILCTTAGGIPQWANKLNLGLVVYAVSAYSTSFPYTSTHVATSQVSAYIIGYNTSTGAISWQRQLNGFDAINDDGLASCQDSSGNSYHLIQNNTGNINLLLVKYNSSGTLQWQRRITVPSTHTLRWKTMTTDGTNLYFKTDTGNATASQGTDIMRYPCDGSVTGTYSYRGNTLTISASSLTQTTPSLTVSNPTINRSTMNQWTNLGSTSTSTPSYTITQKTAL